MSLLHIKIKRADFFYLISQAYSLIEKRNIMPILSKVLISATKDHLCIRATDQDNSLQSKISAKVLTEGEVVIDAQNLYDILKELPEGEIDLQEKSTKKIKLQQGFSEFNLLSLKVEDFPAFPSFEIKESFSIKSSVLKYLIERTSYCSSLDETRYHLTGVFFDIIKSPETNSFNFRFVATDGHRLGLAEYPCEKSLLKNGVIISKKGIQEIKKIISYTSLKEDVEVSLCLPRILFSYDNVVLSVKLVEGKYPNYKPLIPKSHSVSVIVNKQNFSQTLKRVSLLSNIRFKSVNFYIEKDKIKMEAENPELGSAQDEISSVRQQGEDIKVRFNARYILEALNSIETEKISLEFNNNETPCIIRPVLDKKDSNKDQNSLCVVMPMKL